MTETPVKTVNGIDIFLNDRGTFTATINGKKVTRSSLKNVVGEIQSTQSPVTLYAIGDYYNGKHVTPYQIVKFSDSNVATDSEGETHKSHKNFYYLQDDQVEKLEKLSKQIESIFTEWESIVDRGTRVNCHNFEKIRSKSQ